MEKQLDTSKGILDSYHLWLRDAEKAVEEGWEGAEKKVIKHFGLNSKINISLII